MPAETGPAAGSSQRTARDSGGGKIGSGEELMPGRMTGPGTPMGPAPSPLFFVSVADKGFRRGVCSPDAAAAGGWRGVDSLRDAGSGRTALSVPSGEMDRVGFNTECTEFTEDERRGRRPPPRGVREL
jgi:hypothetical protein